MFLGQIRSLKSFGWLVCLNIVHAHLDSNAWNCRLGSRIWREFSSLPLSQTRDLVTFHLKCVAERFSPADNPRCCFSCEHHSPSPLLKLKLRQTPPNFASAVKSNMVDPGPVMTSAFTSGLPFTAKLLGIMQVRVFCMINRYII